MSQLISKISSKTAVWTINKRYKVGSPTTHNGSNWINETGHNSEPGVGSDWKFIGSITTFARPKQEFEAEVGGQSEFTVTNGVLTDDYDVFVGGSLQVKAYSSRVGQVVTTVVTQPEGTIIHI